MKIETILILFIWGVLLANCAIAQEVEHNYLVGPQATNCDSLQIDENNSDQIINQIRTAKFRFNQEFKLTRKNGLQQGEYFSCNGNIGYLIITYDAKQLLFKNVDKRQWKQLISSSDPEGYYLNVLDKLQRIP